METVKETGLSGAAIALIVASGALLQNAQLYEGIAAGVLGLAALALKYFLRG